MVLPERDHAHCFQLDRRRLETGLLAQLAPCRREWCLAASDPPTRQVERGSVGGANQEQGVVPPDQDRGPFRFWPAQEPPDPQQAERQTIGEAAKEVHARPG